MTTVIKHPISTEKAVRLMETENKLVFIVDRNSNKSDIKKAIENMFKVKINKINTVVIKNDKKKAYVKLSKENKAIDVATELGLV